MKHRETFVSYIPKTRSECNPLIHCPKRQHIAMLIEAVISFTEAVNCLCCIKLVREISREYIAFRVEPETQAVCADFRHLASHGVIERDGKWVSIDDDLAIVGC